MTARSGSGGFVVAFGLLGLLLVLAPWSLLWDGSVRSLLPATLAPWLLSGWARGAVTALGVLDLWVALQLLRGE